MAEHCTVFSSQHVDQLWDFNANSHLLQKESSPMIILKITINSGILCLWVGLHDFQFFFFLVSVKMLWSFSRGLQLICTSHFVFLQLESGMSPTGLCVCTFGPQLHLRQIWKLQEVGPSQKKQCTEGRAAKVIPGSSFLFIVG